MNQMQKTKIARYIKNMRFLLTNISPKNLISSSFFISGGFCVFCSSTNLFLFTSSFPSGHANSPPFQVAPGARRFSTCSSRAKATRLAMIPTDCAQSLERGGRVMKTRGFMNHESCCLVKMTGSLLVYDNLYKTG